MKKLKIIESTIPINDIDDLWLDTSNPTNSILKQSIAGTWQPVNQIDIPDLVSDANKMNISGDNSNLTKLQFDITTPLVEVPIGCFRWNNVLSILQYRTSTDSYIDIGEEIQYHGKNVEDNPMVNGDIVYVYGAAGDNPTIKLATNAVHDTANKTLGMVTENTINKNSTGRYCIVGSVMDVNTATYPVGTILYLATGGKYTSVKPTAPTPAIQIGIVLRENANNGIIYFTVRPIPEIGDLSDVYIPAKVNNDTLKFNSTTSRFETYSLNHIISDNIRFTPEGGLAIKIVNGTGSPSVKGTLISVNPSVDKQGILQSNEFDTFGIAYESGIANGSEMWVVISGYADILFKDSTVVTRGYLAIAADTDGRAVTIAIPSSNPTVGEHFKEIGHCLESKIAGTNVLARCVIHFN